MLHLLIESAQFEDMESWKKARTLSQDIFLISNTGDFFKDFELKNQIRASSGSIMDNIAEGFGRGSNKEFIQFLFIARGSAHETKSQLYRILDRNYLSKEALDKFFKETETIITMLNGLISYLQKSDNQGFKFNKS